MIHWPANNNLDPKSNCVPIRALNSIADNSIIMCVVFFFINLFLSAATAKERYSHVCRREFKNSALWPKLSHPKLCALCD